MRVDRLVSSLALAGVLAACSGEGQPISATQVPQTPDARPIGAAKPPVDLNATAEAMAAAMLAKTRVAEAGMATAAKENPTQTATAEAAPTPSEVKPTSSPTLEPTVTATQKPEATATPEIPGDVKTVFETSATSADGKVSVITKVIANKDFLLLNDPTLVGEKGSLRVFMQAIDNTLLTYALAASKNGLNPQQTGRLVSLSNWYLDPQTGNVITEFANHMTVEPNKFGLNEGQTGVVTDEIAESLSKKEVREGQPEVDTIYTDTDPSQYTDSRVKDKAQTIKDLDQFRVSTTFVILDDQDNALIGQYSDKLKPFAILANNTTFLLVANAKINSGHLSVPVDERDVNEYILQKAVPDISGQINEVITPTPSQ